MYWPKKSPVIYSGSNTVGSVVTASLFTGYVSNGGVWKANGVDIAGATTTSYTLLTADIGKVIEYVPNELKYTLNNIKVVADTFTSGITVATTKFSRASNQYLRTLKSGTNITYPDGDWTLGFFVRIVGEVTGNAQYILSNGSFGNSDSLNLLFSGNSFQLYHNGTGSVSMYTSSNYTSGDYLVTLSRQGAYLVFRTCVPLLNPPIDGSAVVSDTTGATSLQKALPGEGADGTAALVIGGRNDLTQTRAFDQAIGRLFLVPTSLSNFDIAQLAYGKEITELGHTPIWNMKMATVNDLTDTGTSGNVYTKTGTTTDGGVIQLGYRS